MRHIQGSLITRSDVMVSCNKIKLINGHNIPITTTFRPKIQRPNCRIFDTSLSHVRHYDFFLASMALRQLSDIFPFRRLSDSSVYRRLNVNRRLSDI